MKERWSRWVVEHPWLVVMVSLLLTSLVGSQLQYFEKNNDPRIFFTEDNPDFREFRELEDRFTSMEVVLFVVHPRNNDVFTREALMAIEALTEDAWTLPNSTRVDSLANYQHTSVQGDDLFVSYLVENAGELDDEDIAAIRSIAVNEPILTGRLVSRKGHVAAIVTTVTMTEGNREAPLITAAAQQMVAEYRERFPDIDFLLTGTVVFAQATDEATQQTIAVTWPLATLAMIICLLLMLRSIMFVVVVISAIILSIAVAIGAGIWWGIEFSPVVGMAPAMILTLAVADCVHLLSTYRQERLRGIDKKLAMRESLRINFQPVWLTSITTAIGFAILNFSESEPFQALGNVVLVGVLAAFVFSVAFLPALVMLVPHRITPARQSSYDPWMQRLANFVIRRYRVLLAGTGLIVVTLVACLPFNQINDVFNEYFDETFEVRRVNDFVMKELTGMHRIDYSIDSGKESGTMEPAYLKQLDAFVAWLNEQPEVVYVNAYTDVIKRLNRDMHGGDPDWYRIPEERDLVSQYTLLFELSLPQGLGLENQLDMSRQYSRVVVMLKNIGSHPVLDFNARAEQWLQDNTQPSMHARGTGMDILFGRVTYRNIDSMLTGAAIGLVTVSALLVLALRSWWYGFLSLLPNLLPALMSFGLWGLVNGEIGLAVSVVACMTFGIVVDDTVHFLSKYVRARRELGLGVDEAVRYAFRTVGVALIATTVVLVANFAVIGTSHFYPSASMGALAAITLAVALLVDFFFFVPLLVWLDRRRAGSGAVEAVVK